MSIALDSFNDINVKITKLFNNPNINFFIIMILIFLISCYTFINTSLRYSISSFIANPVIIVFGLIFVICIGYYNINIGILLLLLLFIALYGTSIFNSKNSNSNSNSNSSNSLTFFTEGFTDDTYESYKPPNESDESDKSDKSDESDESDDESETSPNTIKLSKIKQKTGYDKKIDNDKKIDEHVDSIKNVIFGTINNIKDKGESDYQKSILENKEMMYNNEKKNNKILMHKKGKKNSKNNKNNNNSKEEFHTIETRTFNPANEEDTNLLITKEILQDMSNRIDYNFESTKYLKKYLKHRIEEIVDINKLLEYDED